MYFDLRSFEFVSDARGGQADAVVGSDRVLTWQALREEACQWAA